MRPNPRGLGATDQMCLCFCQSSLAQPVQPQLVFAAGRPVASRRGSQATLGVRAAHTNVHLDKCLWTTWLCRGGGWSDLPPLPIDGINNTKRVILLHFVLVSESIPCPEREAALVCPCPTPPGLHQMFRFSGVNDVLCQRCRSRPGSGDTGAGALGLARRRPAVAQRAAVAQLVVAVAPWVVGHCGRSGHLPKILFP